MDKIDMKKDYVRGEIVLVSVDGRLIPAEYIQKRGENHEVLISPRHIIPRSTIEDPEYDNR